MANVTDKSILTAAGKALLAQLNAEEKALVIDKMIFANVPNRPEYPQSDDVVPSNDVVHEAAVEQRGRLSVDSVIYSTTLTSQEGPFEFNWTGAYCSEYGVLVTIDHHALTPKTVDEPGVSGNTLVRSVVLEYKDIAEITNITVDASTWQYNATPRMKKMDDDVAQAIIDQNGKDWFIEDGFLVTPQASAFNIKAGAGYVSGNRVALEFDRSIQVPNKPSFIYIDAHREGTPTGEQVTLFNFVVSAEEKDDYTDANGVKHFVCKIAQVLGDGSVSDLRPEGDSKRYANTTSNDGDSQLGGNIWPISPTDKAEDGDDLTGYSYIRLFGGNFPVITQFALVKKDGSKTPLTGVLSNINLSTAPYSATVGDDDVYLAIRKYWEMPISGIDVRAFGAEWNDSTDDSDAVQAWVNYLGISHASGQFPENTGQFSGVLINTKYQGLTIKGVGKQRSSVGTGATILKNNKTTPMFIIAGSGTATGLDITNFSFRQVDEYAGAFFSSTNSVSECKIYEIDWNLKNKNTGFINITARSINNCSFRHYYGTAAVGQKIPPCKFISEPGGSQFNNEWSDWFVNSNNEALVPMLVVSDGSGGATSGAHDFKRLIFEVCGNGGAILCESIKNSTFTLIFCDDTVSKKAHLIHLKTNDAPGSQPSYFNTFIGCISKQSDGTFQDLCIEGPGTGSQTTLINCELGNIKISGLPATIIGGNIINDNSVQKSVKIKSGKITHSSGISIPEIQVGVSGVINPGQAITVNFPLPFTNIPKVTAIHVGATSRDGSLTISSETKTSFSVHNSSSVPTIANWQAVAQL
ncbi:hypothetical protein VFDL14_01740 [Vibrio fortis]|uniref:Phage tail fibre protein N-terminal domain-containing protein n=1 Tax=Vibrio fortis TaxID=212667 RepID=A0A066UUV7_9VIBR|nr:phage tail protein [Vibrio fortis]KDN27993.1 hypothetical protein VFDL14_01740 [Vibrio fortis]